jgi:hypothetical protein
MAHVGFSSEGVEPMGAFTPLAPDRYAFIITETDVKDTKSGGGQFLLVVAQVDGGEDDGRKLFLRYNIANKSKQAEDIAKRELAALMGAVGMVNLEDSDDLIGKRFEADVIIDRNKETGQEGNRVKAYYAPAGQQAATPATKPSSQAAAPSRKPWQKAAA